MPSGPHLTPSTMKVAEKLAVGELVVGTYVEHIHLAFAPRAGIAGALAGAHHIELLVVGREAQPVGIGYLLLGDHQVDAPAGVDAIAVGGQLALGLADLGRLADAAVEPARGVAGPAGIVGRSLVELATVGRIGKPVAAIGMGNHVVGRVEALAVVAVGDDRDRAVELVAYDPPGQMLATELAPLEVEGIAVA